MVILKLNFSKTFKRIIKTPTHKDYKEILKEVTILKKIRNNNIFQELIDYTTDLDRIISIKYLFYPVIFTIYCKHKLFF